MVAPASAAIFWGASVSAVSPDWLTAMTRVRSSIGGCVAHLAPDHAGCRKLRPLLHQVGAHVTGIAGRPAADQVHPLRTPQLVLDRVELRKRHLTGRRDAAPQRLLDGVRLLVDLLEGEMREAALLGGGDVPLDVRHRPIDRDAVEANDPHPIGADHRDVPLVEDHHVLCVLQDGGHVAGQETLTVAQPHDQRHVHPGADDLVGMIVVHDTDRVRAAHLVEGRADRLDEIAGVLCLDQVDEHLGIGFAQEPMAGRLQAGLDLEIVLDDPVVDQRQLPGAVPMRMRVRIVGSTVRRPARVRDPGVACRRPAVQVLGQVGELARLLLDEDAPLRGEERDACRVVAAILEPPQPVDQDRRSVSRTDVADDAAHGAPPLRFSRLAGVRASVQPCVGELCQLARDLLDLGLLVALDHDPNLGLGARRPDEDPSPLPQACCRAGHRR